MGIQSLFLSSNIGISGVGCGRYIPESRLGKVALAIGVLFSGVLPGLIAWGMYCAGVAIRNSLQGRISRSQPVEADPIASRVAQAAVAVLPPPPPVEDSELDRVILELDQVLDSLQTENSAIYNQLLDLIALFTNDAPEQPEEILESLRFCLECGRKELRELRREREREARSPLPPVTPPPSEAESVVPPSPAPLPASIEPEVVAFQQTQAAEKEKLVAFLSLVLGKQISESFAYQLIPSEAKISFDKADENGVFSFKVASPREFEGACAGVPATVHLPQGEMAIKIDPRNQRISFENTQFFFKAEKSKLPAWVVGIPEQFGLLSLTVKEGQIIPEVQVSSWLARKALSAAIGYAEGKKWLPEQIVLEVWNAIIWH